MKVTKSFQKDRRRLEFRIEPAPGFEAHKIADREVFFEMLEGWSEQGTHPDLMALVALLLVHPFVDPESGMLDLDWDISSDFAAACASVIPYPVTFRGAEPGKSAIEPRKKGATPALSFSGGVDSSAALGLMPEETALFFLNRVNFDGSEPQGLYDKRSALYACEWAERLGYQVHRIPTSLEFVRSPVGFPVDWSTGAPAVLHADTLNLSSISWGVVAESAYRVGHEHYIDFKKRTIFRRWDCLLRAVGLALGAPVAGVSEVGTSTIVLRDQRLNGIAQSCIRGDKNKPCMNCFKCFRKSLLDAAILGEEYQADLFSKVLRFRGGEKIVLGSPIKHENVFRWLAERLRVDVETPDWLAFKNRLSVGHPDVGWAARWYGPAEELIPSEYRASALRKMSELVPRQSSEEERAFEEWDLRPTFQTQVHRDTVAGLENRFSG